jgi:hypothetical protein
MIGVAVLGQLVKPLDRVLRHDHVLVGRIGQRVAALPLGDLGPPVGKLTAIGLLRSPPQTHHVLENVADVAENADIGADILVDRGRVDVDVDLLRVGRERIEPPGDAVIKTGADVRS